MTLSTFQLSDVSLIRGQLIVAWTAGTCFISLSPRNSFTSAHSSCSGHGPAAWFSNIFHADHHCVVTPSPSVGCCSLTQHHLAMLLRHSCLVSSTHGCHNYNFMAASISSGGLASPGTSEEIKQFNYLIMAMK